MCCCCGCFVLRGLRLRVLHFHPPFELFKWDLLPGVQTGPGGVLADREAIVSNSLAGEGGLVGSRSDG